MTPQKYQELKVGEILQAGDFVREGGDYIPLSEDSIGEVVYTVGAFFRRPIPASEETILSLRDLPCGDGHVQSMHKDLEDIRKIQDSIQPTAASEEGELFRCGGCGRLFPSESHATLCSHDSTEKWIREIQRENQSLTRKVEELESTLKIADAGWQLCHTERDSLRAEIEQVRLLIVKWQGCCLGVNLLNEIDECISAWHRRAVTAEDQRDSLQSKLDAAEKQTERIHSHWQREMVERDRYRVERDAATAELKKVREAMTNLHDTAIDAFNFLGGANPPISKSAIIDNLRDHCASARSALKDVGK